MSQTKQETKQQNEKQLQVPTNGLVLFLSFVLWQHRIAAALR
jgi:hypothetical protein